MNRSILRQTVLAIAVVLGLGFGFQEVAVASEAQRTYCTMDCQQVCDDLYGRGVTTGLCGPRNTCHCL